MYVFFPLKSPTKTARNWTCRLGRLFWSQGRVFSSRIHSTQLSSCIESISWALFTWRPWMTSKITSAEEHVIDIIFPWFDRRRLLIDLHWSVEAPKFSHASWTWSRDKVSLLQSPLHHPYSRAFCTLPSFTRIKRPSGRMAPRRTQRSARRHLRCHGKNRILWRV